MRTLSAAAILSLAGSQAWSQPAKSVPSQPVVVRRVADPAAWKRLRDRVLKNAGVRQQVTINGTDYTILSVVSTVAFPGQDCPSGTQPRNAAHFTFPAPPVGADVYPARLTAACVTAPDDSSAHDMLAVNADADGKIIDAAVYDAALGLSTHPMAEPVPVPGDTQTSNLATVLGRLVKHLAE